MSIHSPAGSGLDACCAAGREPVDIIMITTPVISRKPTGQIYSYINPNGVYAAIELTILLIVEGLKVDRVYQLTSNQLHVASA
jgi:uncharacterized membrane protein